MSNPNKEARAWTWCALAFTLAAVAFLLAFFVNNKIVPRAALKMPEPTTLPSWEEAAPEFEAVTNDNGQWVIRFRKEGEYDWKYNPAQFLTKQEAEQVIDESLTELRIQYETYKAVRENVR